MAKKQKTQKKTPKRKSASRSASARTSRRKPTRRKAPAPRKPAPRKASIATARASVPDRDGLFRRMLDRAKHVFKQPLDPRIAHLVEVFGEEAVKGLIAAFRKSNAVAENEIAEAIARGEAAMGPSPHGSWAWHELMTSDVAGAKRFYSSMFGWDASDVEMMPGFNYTIFRRAGREVAGLMGIGPEHGEMPSGWGVYIAVDDVDAATEKAERLGGEVIVPAHDIPVGRWAMIKDPGGAVLCLYRAKVETSVKPQTAQGLTV